MYSTPILFNILKKKFFFLSYVLTFEFYNNMYPLNSYFYTLYSIKVISTNSLTTKKKEKITTSENTFNNIYYLFILLSIIYSYLHNIIIVVSH